MNKKDFLELFSAGFLSGIGLIGLIFLIAVGLFF